MMHLTEGVANCLIKQNQDEDFHWVDENLHDFPFGCCDQEKSDLLYDDSELFDAKLITAQEWEKMLADGEMDLVSMRWIERFGDF